MDAPTISTLPLEDDDTHPDAGLTNTFVVYAPQAPKSPPQGTGRFRLNKIKLRLPERDPAAGSRDEPTKPGGSEPTFNVTSYDSHSRAEPPAYAGEDDEEDQLMDDDLGMAPSSSAHQAQSTKPPPAKKARTRAPKNTYPGQSQVSTLLSQSSAPARAHGDHDTMISAWQVDIPGSTPNAVRQI